MGFWGKVGGVLKKAAPIAAAFIPGVGPIASALIGAGLGAATTKGGLKSRLLGAGLGALPTKGLGPTGSTLKNITGKVITGAKMLTGQPDYTAAAGTGGKGYLKSDAFGQNLKGAIAQSGNDIMSQFARGGQSQPDYNQPDYNQRNEFPVRGMGPSRNMDMGMSRRQQMNPMGMADQNNPNLSMFIGQGRREAINDQPFRRGYEVNYLGSDDETPYKTRMPRIGSVMPQRNRGGGRQQQAAY